MHVFARLGFIPCSILCFCRSVLRGWIITTNKTATVAVSNNKYDMARSVMQSVYYRHCGARKLITYLPEPVIVFPFP